MTLNARPHRNGNQRSDFVDAYKALTAALTAVGNAYSLIGGNVTHGRNYQHIGADAADILNNDKRFVLKQSVAAIDALNAIKDAIEDAIKSDQN
jgi:hypothetical protein